MYVCMYAAYVMHVCMSCMYVMDGWMDGWMDGSEMDYGFDELHIHTTPKRISDIEIEVYKEEEEERKKPTE